MRRPSGPQIINSHRHDQRLQLTLEFNENISSAKAEQVARRLIEALQISTLQNPEGLKSARLICHQTRQVITLINDTGQERSDRAD